MSDDGFHEIQLNGKQLVFLFMAATVVSVVIFLCGVMVGRGVQTARAEGDESMQRASAAEVRPIEPARGEPNAAGSAPPDAEPAPVDDDYYDRLVEGGQRESLETPREPARPATRSAPARDTREPSKPAPRERVSEKPLPATTTGGVKPAAKPTPPPPTPEPKPGAAGPVAATSGPSSGGYAVQLAALRERNEAEAIAKRLVAKGYQAYVLNPAPGAPPVYRVQVGRFGSRSEADGVAARLRKEERFDPWVTR